MRVGFKVAIFLTRVVLTLSYGRSFDLSGAKNPQNEVVTGCNRSNFSGGNEQCQSSSFARWNSTIPLYHNNLRVFFVNPVIRESLQMLHAAHAASSYDHFCGRSFLDRIPLEDLFELFGWFKKNLCQIRIKQGFGGDKGCWISNNSWYSNFSCAFFLCLWLEISKWTAVQGAYRTIDKFPRSRSFCCCSKLSLLKTNFLSVFEQTTKTYHATNGLYSIYHCCQNELEEIVEKSFRCSRQPLFKGACVPQCENPWVFAPKVLTTFL